ncbi:MAG: ribosome assembly RNA-binding protein YhbY [Myxococcales bacterium]|nr:ribosome assembly RNA-binding protein YhbY [Myxococcales bacterium]
MDLTPKQRRFLRGRAHDLDPAVRVGAAGVTDGVIHAIDTALEARELIKVKLDGDRHQRAEAVATIAERTRSAVAQTIGRVVVLYRPAKEAERRAISLPRE